MLPAGRTDYVYTDISAGFFADAEERLAGMGAELEYRVLDIERDPAEQGFGIHGFDLVLAANVLHATRDLGESLRHCRRLLAPSGLLVALEALGPQGWADLTFGLLPGWWRFDDRYRDGHPLVGVPGWRRALADAGYGEVGVLGPEDSFGVLVARGPAVVRPEPGLWVVFPGEGALAGELVRELEGRGQRVIVTPEADGFVREGWRDFLAGLPEGELTGVVHLGAAGKSEADATAPGLQEDVERAGRSALALVQGLADAEVVPASGLWFVTRGGQVLAEDRPAGLAGAALWGFGRAVAQELVNVRVRLLDLDPAGGPDAAELAAELLYPDEEREAARRGPTRRTPRLVRAPAPPPAAGAASSPPVRPDRSYLVTGGLGGIGLAVAEWLLDEGAGAVVLSGRRAPGPEAAEEVARLRARVRERDGQVRVETADVTDGEAVARLVSGIGAEAGLPPLGGVFHSVGVLADAALANQDWAAFERVLWPKVLGAWRLHQETRSLDLDLFVLFSSLSGLFGTPGQSNYAAANVFLDQLALYRRSLGLAGQTVVWGPWEGVGWGATERERIAPGMEQAGVGWVLRGQALRALARLLREDVPVGAVASVDWPALGAGMGRPPALVSDLAGSGGDEAAPGGAGDLAARLGGAAAMERERLAVEFVREATRSVLRLGELPAAELGFFELGMDSLMAVELRNRLNRGLAGAYVVPNTAVFDYPTPGRLGRHLLEQLGATAPPAAAVPRREPRRGEDRVAVVGMACRFPGGPDAAGFWAQLAAGRQAVTRGRAEELFPEEGNGRPAPFGAYLPELDRFRRGVLPDSSGGGGTDGSPAAAAAGSELGGARGRGPGPAAAARERGRRLRGDFGLRLPGADRSGRRGRGAQPVFRDGHQPVGGHRAGGVRARVRGPRHGRGNRVFGIVGGAPPGGHGARARRGRPGARRRGERHPVPRCDPFAR